MPMHWVPWLAGGFLLTPFMVWFVLAGFVFPGAWNGFNAIVGTSALGASLPLAVWFFLRGIGGFANAMAGADPDGELTHWLPRMLLRLLPLSAVLLGLAGAAWVLSTSQPTWTTLAPLSVGLIVAVGIRGGEHGVSRGLVRVPKVIKQRAVSLIQGSALARELLNNERGGRDWFLMNLVLVGVLTMMTAGASPAALTIGLLTVPVGFAAIYLSHRGRDSGGTPTA